MGNYVNEWPVGLTEITTSTSLWSTSTWIDTTWISADIGKYQWYDLAGNLITVEIAEVEPSPILFKVDLDE